MSIEGLGRKFQEARKARNLSLEEAARLTRIRQSRLAEIEADDFSNFPSLAYAKGFLQIYGKFLEVDVSPYLDAFETSGPFTVDGYSYLQDAPAPKAPRGHRSPRRTENARPSLVPFLIGIAILVAGFSFLRFISKLNQIAPHPTEAAASATPSATVATIVAPRALPVESPARVAATAPPAVEPEVRRAVPVRPDEVAAAEAANETIDAEGPNRIDIKPLKRTYMQVTIDDDPTSRHLKGGFRRPTEQSNSAVTASACACSIAKPSRFARTAKSSPTATPICE